MVSTRQKLVNIYVRLVQKPALAVALPVRVTRRLVDLSCRFTYKTPPNLRVAPVALEHEKRPLPAFSCDLGGDTGRGTILYLHGGGFVLGSIAVYRHLLGRLANASGMAGLFVDYRRAPEHPFPAGLDDAWGAYRALLAAGHRPRRIALAGDSAGGDLVFALLYRILSEGAPAPGAVVALSPVTDLTGQSPSLKSNLGTEMLVPAGWARRSVEAYVGSADRTDPRLSPVFGSFAGAPPVLIHCAEGEALQDDARRMAEVLHGQGVSVTLEEWTGVPHVWHLFVGRSPEADRAVADAARFLRDTIGG